MNLYELSFTSFFDLMIHKQLGKGIVYSTAALLPISVGVGVWGLKIMWHESVGTVRMAERPKVLRAVAVSSGGLGFNPSSDST